MKGPEVWMGMDQAELDAAYDQFKYAPNGPQIVRRYAINSESNRRRLGAPQRHAYGSTLIEGLDLYRADKSGGRAPVNIFVHGGAWRTGLAKDYAFAAEMFVNAGVHLVVPDFVWVQDADGDLRVMASQLQRAVAWVYRNAPGFGGDSNRIFMSGHSSGAHLTSVLMTTPWQKSFNLPENPIKGAVCCSGVYDLKPVRLSARSKYVKFTDEVEDALSPQRHVDQLNAPLVVAYGSLETPEYQRQARDFAAAAKAAGKPVHLLRGDEYNHFEIIETLASPHGLLGRAVLEQMNLI